MPTTSLRSLRNCDSSFAAISNHSIQVERKIDLTPAPLLLTISQPQSAGPDSAAKIVSPESRVQESTSSKSLFATLSNLLAHFQQHHRTAKHSVQKPNSFSHSEAITHTPPLTDPPSPHCQSRTSTCTVQSGGALAQLLSASNYNARHADLVTGSDLSEEATRKATRFSLSPWLSPFNAVSARKTFPLCNLSIHLLENFSEYE